MSFLPFPEKHRSLQVLSLKVVVPAIWLLTKRHKQSKESEDARKRPPNIRLVLSDARLLAG
jgi:hypothetical protein